MPRFTSGSPLGGSPLGLINVRSLQTNEGAVTFGDSVSTLNVNQYNAGEKTANWANGAGKKGNSMFTGVRTFRAYPDISVLKNGKSDSAPGAEEAALDKDSTAKKPVWKKTEKLHNNQTYDTSILNIIQRLKGTRGEVNMADFAYIKDLGAIPNNRLIICRKYGGAVGDNIFAPHGDDKKKKNARIAPYSTLITYLPPDDDFLKISFGEKWVDAEADFKDLLNRIGADVLGANTAGKVMESLGNAIPLPGFTEIFQRRVLQKLGFITNADMIPAGNPNLIKEAKRRTTIPYEQAGSGLSCKLSLNLKFEYEIKFISGIDPTMAWMDLIGNILRFGTSESSNYGLTGKLGKIINNLLSDPIGFVVSIVKTIINSLQNVIAKLQQEINDMAKKAGDAAAENQKKAEGNNGLTPAEQAANKKKRDDDANLTKEQKEERAKENIKKARDKAEKGAKKVAQEVLNAMRGFINSAAYGISQKYRIEIQGILAALSGMPSTPWHVTIGNPLRPVFCAGDMYTDDVSLTLGPVLAFNDLPSSITVEFTLQPARSWGLQEIMAKFNSGYMRSIDAQKSFLELSSETPGDAGKYKEKTEKLNNKANASPNEFDYNKDVDPDDSKGYYDAGQPGEIYDNDGYEEKNNLNGNQNGSSNSTNPNSVSGSGSQPSGQSSSSSTSVSNLSAGANNALVAKQGTP